MSSYRERLKLTDLVAITHLVKGRRQTIIAGLGVTFGIAAYVFLLNFVEGLNKVLHDLMVDQTPHVRLYSEETADREMILERQHPGAATYVHSPKPLNRPARIHDGLQMLQVLKAKPEVTDAGPVITTQVFYKVGAVQQASQVRGIDPEAEDRMFDLASDIVQGKLSDLKFVPNAVILGKGLAGQLGVSVGDYVESISAQEVSIRLKVVGISSAGVAQVDDVRCYVTLRTAQRMLNENTQYVNELNVKVNDADAAPDIARLWRLQFGYPTESWQEANASALVGDRIRETLFGGVVLVMLVVAGFGIYNVLSMMIREKMNDIAILKAMGLTGKDVQQIFLREAIFIGVAGGLVGMLLGMGVIYGVRQIPFDFGGIIDLNHLPVGQNPLYFATGFFFGIFVTVFAAYFPARKAGRVDPISILRGQ